MVDYFLVIQAEVTKLKPLRSEIMLKLGMGMTNGYINNCVTCPCCIFNSVSVEDSKKLKMQMWSFMFFLHLCLLQFLTCRCSAQQWWCCKKDFPKIDGGHRLQLCLTCMCLCVEDGFWSWKVWHVNCYCVVDRNCVVFRVLHICGWLTGWSHEWVVAKWCAWWCSGIGPVFVLAELHWIKSLRKLLTRCCIW